MNAHSSTTISKWLLESTQKLRGVGIESAQLDALVLLENVLRKDRAQLLAQTELLLKRLQLTQLDQKLARRVAREPIAYIVGHKEFYGREFTVNNHVLIPRPESESFILLLLKKPERFTSIIDVGTGSGCLGITAQLELPGVSVMLSDVSQEALEVAKINAKQLGADVGLKQSNLLSAFNNYNTVLANLPYVPRPKSLKNTQKELLYEPEIALFAGDDGMQCYRQFWKEIEQLHDRPQFVLTESLKSQHEPMIELTIKSGYKIEDNAGLVQLFVRA